MERERKAVVRLTSNNIGEFARKLCQMLIDSDTKIPKQKAADELNLTLGQMSALVKYMRRCSLVDLKTYIKYYPISSKQGYSLPKSWEDFLPCFSTLYCWANSIIKTIDPMRQKMEMEGIDIAKYMIENGNDEAIEENYLEGFTMNKNTSWFFEEDDK